MKSTILIAVLITLGSFNSMGQQLDCGKFKNGNFKILRDLSVPESHIIRNGNTQTETNVGEDEISEFIVNWSDDCTYTLTPTKKTRKQFKGLPKNAMLTVQIIETKENSYIQKSTANFSDFETITEVIKTE
jgi:hypothetical protein